MSNWTTPPEEFAVKSVINTALSNVKVQGEALVQPKLRDGRAKVEITDLPAGGMTGPLKDGMVVPRGNTAMVQAKVEEALIASGALAKGEFSVSITDAPEWAAKQGKAKLAIEVPDLGKVNIKAAADYIDLNHANDASARITAQALRNKAAKAQIV